MKRLALVLGLWFLPALALALPGEECTPNTTPACTRVSHERCWFVCHNNTTGGGANLNCGPFAFDPGDTADQCWVGVSNVPAACVLKTVTVEESNLAVSGGTNVWHTIFTSGKGVGAGGAGDIDATGDGAARSLGRVPGPALRASHADFADADCTDVDLVVCCN